MIPIGETRDGRADMTNWEMDLFDTRFQQAIDKDDSDECCKHSIIKPACLPVTILAVLLLMTFFIPLFNDEGATESLKKYERTGICTDECRLELVESIPRGMNYSGYHPHKTTSQAWIELLESAQTSLDIAALYWTLRDTSGHPSSLEGARIFRSIVETGNRGVKIRIAQNQASREFPQLDSAYLEAHGLADVRSLNFTALMGSGVLHTKLWIVDQKDIYIGSANMDWRSLTEVKELGVVVRNCSCLANDLGKIFTVYWRLGDAGARVHTRWPINLRTQFNFNHSLDIDFNEIKSRTFISSAPAGFNPKGREHDLNAIIGLMENSTQYIRISVMDYLPTTLYMGANKNYYWPPIDDAIRSAAYRGVRVEMLISQWRYSRREIIPYLRALLQINKALPRVSGSISVKLFTVPPVPEQVEHTRVNHAKYMVTERAAYVGTSNWAGDYFINTAGVGFVVAQAPDSASNELVEEFNRVFLRDWNSPYAKELQI